MNVDLLPCCKPRLLEQENWGTSRNFMDMLEKVLEDSETEEQDKKQLNEEDGTRKMWRGRRVERGEKLDCRCVLKLIPINQV